jgi:two-component system cell cycle sensor histidine kinase PleC
MGARPQRNVNISPPCLRRTTALPGARVKDVSMSVGTDDTVASDRGDATPVRPRAVSMKMREVRERLTSTNGLRPAFDFELTRQFAQTRQSSALVVLVMILFIAMASTLWASGFVLAIWLVTAVGAQAILATMVRRFLGRSHSAKEVSTWRKRFALGEAINGASWAMLGLHLVSLDSQASNPFVLFLVMLVVAMATMLSATIPAVMYAGALPITVVVVASCAALGTVSGSTTAVMVAGAVAYFLVLGNKLHRSAVETLEFRAEKDALIAELEQAKLNSDEARRRAEEANLAKSRFLATMSHELRTPLNAILGFSEVMKSEVFGPLNVPNYKEYVTDIHASGQHLLNLINEILDLSRIEAGRYELNEEAVKLAHVADECHHLLKLRAKAKGIVIHETMEPGMPPLWADERAVRQVTLNLLSNAIKFTPQGGEVRMRVGWTSSGGQYLMITDTGPGIPEEEIPTVLSSFGRGSLAIKTAEQGTGLGLPIVKGLIDLHGGRFALRSKLREGTQVTVTFPPERVMQALAPILEGRPPGSVRAA